MTDPAIPSAEVFVCDLRHFLDMPAEAPAPARRMAHHLSLIVSAATAGDAGAGWVSALPCRRRPGRQPCPGHLALLRTDVPPSIEWRCSSCGDDGVVSGWERSPFDLRRRSSDPVPTEALRVAVPSEVAATLRSLVVIDTDTARLVFRGRPSPEGIVLSGDEDDFDALIDSVAAEMNHEGDRRRRKRLEQAFTVLNEAVEQAQP